MLGHRPPRRLDEHVSQDQGEIMIKRIFTLIAALLCLMPAPTRAEEQPMPLERLILQQHLTQAELERNLALIKAEEKELHTELARLDVELSRQALVIQAMRKHAAQVVRAYYTGERTSLLTLLFDARNFHDLLLVYDFLQMVYERDLDKLERLQAEQAKSKALQQEKEQRLAQLREVRLRFEAQLAEILALQAEKQKNLALLDDPTSVQYLMEHLISDWRQRGLPAFHRFFGTLSEVMPQMIEAFKQLAFRFDDNQLTVDGSYDHMNFQLVGEYELVSPTELKFHIRRLFFDGFELPRTTIQEMEQLYNLGFYPEYISPHVQVEGITLDDQELVLRLKFDLPLPFFGK
jgi:hypothetical protein